MTTGKPHLALKIGALVLALSLSGLYIYFEFRDQPTPEESGPAGEGGEVYPMSKTPDLDLIEALPKSGPIHFDPDSFNPGQQDDASASRPAVAPGFDLDEAESRTNGQPNPRPDAPGFDLNDALSKTGTIKADSLFKEHEKEDAKQPAADDEKE